jgi:hypothetical protein
MSITTSIYIDVWKKKKKKSHFSFYNSYPLTLLLLTILLVWKDVTARLMLTNPGIKANTTETITIVELIVSEAIEA